MNTNNNRSEQLRDIDLIIWGATGFTGKLACAYLSDDSTKFYSYNLIPNSQKQKIKWAVAGRSKSKLSSLLASVSAPPSTPIITIPSVEKKHKELIDNMVKSTKIIVSLAGPFQLYSDSIIESCCRLGTHYVDVTGEPLWVKSCIDKYGVMAKKSKACIVNFCGYDSIPSDLGCLFALNELDKMKKNKEGDGEVGNNDDGRKRRAVTCYQCVFDGGKPGMSGGTLTSGLSSPSHDIHPHLLTPSPTNTKEKETQTFQTKAWFSNDIQSWVGPFPMERINVPATNRSAHHLNYVDGSSSFLYQEVAVAPTEKIAKKMAYRVTNPIPPAKMKQMMDQGRLPKPGQGPTTSHRSIMSFMALLVATEEDEDNEKNKISTCVSIKGGDPGYEETSKMVIESALCLLLQPHSCPGYAQGGFQSAAMCMGHALIGRLHNAGIEFCTVENAQNEVMKFWMNGMKRMEEQKKKKKNLNRKDKDAEDDTKMRHRSKL